MGVPGRQPELQSRPISEPSSSSATAEVVDSTIKNFSLVVGGPAYKFLQRLHLAHQSLPNIQRRTAAVVALTWLPLLLLSLKDGLALGHQVKIPFLYDFSMYGRFLIGLPLLFLAEIVIDPAIRVALKEFVEAGFVKERELLEFHKVLLRAQRLRDSAILEIVLFVLAFFPVFLFQHEWTAGAVSSWHTTAQGLTSAGWWYAIFSAPLMRFITYRWGFRYFVWALLMGRISRLRLVLMPTHPDRAAGLNFLSLTQRNFGILLCALGCSFAGRVANAMFFEQAPLGSFKVLMIGFVVLSVLTGLLPLILLAPTMIRVRKAGLFEYGRLANTYTESFDQKWVHSRERTSESLLGSADIQSLADMGNSFSVIDEMAMAPITRKLLIQLAFQAAIPLIPLIILGTPTPELVHALMKMIA